MKEIDTLFLYYLLALNTITFFIYGYDKAIALYMAKKLSRVSEHTLLIFALLGGSIGSLIAMFVFRHKIKKISFMLKFAGLVFLHVGIIGVYFL